MATQREVIAAFMRSLDTTTLTGEAALDEAIRSCSTFTGFAELKAAMIRDINDARSGDDFLKRLCGIDYDTDDTGAITGSDAGGATSKDKYNVVPEDGDLDTSFTDSEFTVNGLTVKLGDERTFYDLNTTEQFIWQGLYSWWIKASLDLIAESYGDNYSFEGDESGATANEIKVYFYTENSNTLASTWATHWTNTGSWGNAGEACLLHLKINLYHYNGLEKDLDKAKSEFGNTIAHELTHSLMSTVLLTNPVYDSLPGFVSEGLAELTYGAEKFREYSIPYLAKDSAAFEDGLDVSNTGTGEDFMYCGGFMFFRYLARHAGDITISNSDDTLVTTFDGNDTISNSASNASITSGAGNDSITASGSNVSIDVGDGNNYLQFWADTYDSTLIAGDGQNTVETGAKGALINTGASNDSIHIFANAEDNTVYTGDDADTVIGGGQRAFVDTGADNDYLIIYSNEGNATINMGDGADTVNTMAQTASINTGAGNDQIHIYEWATKNTINAGLGDDSIKSETTKGVKFEYGTDDGNDTIDGYNEKDTISYSGEGYYGRSTVGSDTVLDFINGSKVTLLGASDKKIKVKGATFLNIINNRDSSVKVYAVKGEDSITNYADKVTVVGASDRDSIYNHGQRVSIKSDSGDDFVLNYGVDPTVTGTAYGQKAKIFVNNGNDTVSNNGRCATISGGNGKDSIVNTSWGLNSSINGGAGNDEIHNHSNKVTLLGGAGSDSIYNNKWSDGGGDYASINGDADNDLIQNFGTNATLKGGDGSDTIGNYARGYSNGELLFSDGGKNVKIYGGNGDDLITNSASNVSIEGGAGNDTVELWDKGTEITVVGGAGNDSIKNTDASKVLFKYDSGDGKDTIVGFNKTSTLQIGDGTGTYSYQKVGDDKVVSVGSGEIILVDMAKLSSANIKGKVARNVTNSDKSTVKVASDVEVINASARSKAVKITGNSKANSILGGSGNDSINGGSNNDTISGGKGGKDTLIGGNGHDSLSGGSNHDKLSGGAGQDTLDGGTGNDSLSGGSNHDKLYGGKGDDTLIGGTGKDSLWGDAGADTFIYNFGDGQDVIFGFDNKDTLTLDGLDFTSSYKSGVVALKFADGGSVTFKDFTTKTSFHIDDSVYKISGSKLKMR